MILLFALSSTSGTVASNYLPERAILLECKPDTPFGLNLYETFKQSPITIDRTVDAIIQIFRRFIGDDHSFYPRMEYVIRNTARTVIANNATMAEIPKLFSSVTFRNKCLASVQNPATRNFWKDYEGRTPFKKTELIESTLNKLDQFLSSEFIYRVVAQAHTTVPITQIINDL